VEGKNQDSTLLSSERRTATWATTRRRKRPSKIRVQPEDYDGTVVVEGRVLQTTKAFDTFWRYTAERQSVENKRRAGLPAP
jgi:translation initiation factor IF-1